MEKLLDAVLVKFAELHPTTPLTIERKKRIEQRVLQLIPDFHTPSHPPYAAMIHRAIMELNEESGSSEESISSFIRKEYDDLPWAHESYLSHHLENLAQKGEIFVDCNKCYMLNINLEVRKQKGKRGRGERGNETLVEEDSKSLDVNEENRPEKKQTRLRIVHKQKGETEVTKNLRRSKRLQIEALKKQEQSHDHHDEMVEDKNQQQGEAEVFEERQNRPMGPQTELTVVQNQSPEHQYEEEFPPQGESIRVRSEILLPCHDGKGGNSDGNDLKAPPDVTARPIMEEDEQNNCEEAEQPNMKISSERKTDVVCALQAEKKHRRQTKICKLVKLPPLLPALVTYDDLPMDRKQLVGDHERPQRRRQRHRGDKMSDPKPATVTSVVENFPIQHENQLFLPSNLERSMEIKPTSLEETSQSTEQEPKTRSQREQFISRPLGSSKSPQQSVLLEFSNQEEPLELEQNKVEISFGTATQQRQENLQRRNLRSRGQASPESAPVTETVIQPSLSSQNQAGGRRRGRPPKQRKAIVTVIAKLLPSQQKEYHHESKQKRIGRGRPPNEKPDAGTTEEDALQRKQFTSCPLGSSLSPQQQSVLREFSNQDGPLVLERNKVEISFGTVAQQRQENLQRMNLRPREQAPPEPKPSTETVIKPSLLSQYQVGGRRRGRHPKQRKAIVTVNAKLLPSQQKEYHYESKHKRRVRERTPNEKLDSGTTKGDTLQRAKRRGRPPKHKLDDDTLRELLTSQKRRGSRKPPKAKPDASAIEGDILQGAKRKRRGRPRDEDTLIRDLLTSQKRRGPGKPPNAKPDPGTTGGDVLRKRQGTPPQYIPDEDTIIRDLLLTSKNRHQKPKHRL